jgi:NAD(P)H dehydrogenase (quinone)
MIAITGATGQLGALAVEELLKTVKASEIVAIVRNPAKADALARKVSSFARPTTATRQR